MPSWSPDIAVDESIVRTLLRARLPGLPIRTLRLVGEGWDKSVWALNEEWAFAFPRRTVSAALLDREVALLPRIAKHLPLPVPAPVHILAADAGFPWTVAGAPLLPGRELPEARLADAARIPLAVELARFLRALHAPVLADEAGGGLPVDPNGRADMGTLVPRVRERLAESEARGLWSRDAGVDRLLARAERLPRSPARVLVHGDLHARHVLVSSERVTGIIDWGDACLADPSLDLQLAWGMLEGEARAWFLAAYGPVPEERELRARVLALALSAMLALYAESEGKQDLRDEALAGLRRAATEGG